MHGGTIADLGSFLNVGIYGAGFAVDGVPVPGLNTVGDRTFVDLTADSVLSGTLSDGTPFAFSYWDDDVAFSGYFTVELTDVVAAGSDSLLASRDDVGYGVRDGQVLRVDDGGVLPDNYNIGAGSSVIVESGGQVGMNLEVVGAQLTIEGGRVGSFFDAFAGSQVLLAGGTYGEYFTAHPGSAVTISGTDFRLDGQAIEGLDELGDMQSLDLPSGSLLSGTLEDGTPFLFQNQRAIEYFSDGTLTLKRAVVPPAVPSVINLPSDPAPLGVREGQTLVVGTGGNAGDDFNAGYGSTVVISDGGVAGTNFELVGAKLELIRRMVGGDMEAVFGSTVTVVGGELGGRAQLTESTLHVAGGKIGSLTLGSGAQLHLAGGIVDPSVRAEANSTVTIYGTDFQLDGTPLNDNMPLGTPFEIEPRGGTLRGTLADGSAFQFQLLASSRSSPYFSSEAVVNVVLMLPGDFNDDGTVDLADYTVWRDNLGAVPGTLSNDPSGVEVGKLQYEYWKTHFGMSLASLGGTAGRLAAVPEPAAGVNASGLGWLLFCGKLVRRRRVK